jgi:hypothetical protein
MYRIAKEQGGAFKIDPKHMLFVLQERHFGSPVEYYHLQIVEHPSGWWDVRLSI